MTDSGPNDSSESNRLFDTIDRRNFLKATAAATVAAGGVAGSASAQDYDTIQASGQTIYVGAGETWENKLVDLSTGNGFTLIIEGGNSTVRNIGFEGIYRADGFIISITAPSGSVLVENVYIGDGATKEGSSFTHGPGAIFYHRDAGANVTFRDCNVQGYPNNGFYCSNSASGGSITWENCYAKNNGVASYRGADGGDEIINCVAYNDDTEPYFPGRMEDSGRPVWAWNPGPITIENSEFHSGMGSNTYPYALVAGANGDPSQINYNSGDYVGDIQEAHGSSINIAGAVGSSPALNPPASCPTSATEAASGESGGGGGGGSGDPPAYPVIEDFERDNPLADYGGSTGLFSITSSPTYEGSSALVNDGGDFGGVNSTSGLDNYPERGDEFDAHLNNAGDQNFAAVNFFTQAETDGADRYAAGISGVDGEFTLWKTEGDSTQTLDSSALSSTTSGWYRVEISTDSSTVTADLYDDSSGDHLASVSASDSTFSSGGIGFRSAGNGEAFDYAVFDTDPDVVEDFGRSSPLNEYGGSTGLFDTTGDAYEGSQALTNDGGDFGGVNSTSGLDTYPERGDTVHAHFQNAGDQNFAAVNFFAQSETDDPDRYSVGISGVDGEFTLWKTEDGSIETLDSSAPSSTTSGWYRVEFSTDSSTVTADLYDASSDDHLASVSASDSAFSSGGIGFRSAGNGEVFDYVVNY